MFLALFCVLWLFTVYEGNWFLAAGIAILLGLAIFVDHATKFMMMFSEEEVYWDAVSTNMLFSFDAVSDVNSGISGYETGVEDLESAAIYQNSKNYTYKSRIQHPEDRMEKFLKDCLDELGYICFENVHLMSPLSQRTVENEAKLQIFKNEEQPQTAEDEKLSQITENGLAHTTEKEKLLQMTGDENQFRREKGSFKKRFKILLFLCCCFGCGKKN